MVLAEAERLEIRIGPEPKTNNEKVGKEDAARYFFSSERDSLVIMQMSII